jgi:tetratricopeptide (TPR) repeat protein
MMASDRPPPPPPAEAPPAETPIPLPAVPEQAPVPVAPPPAPTHGTLKSSPFLNNFDLVLAIGTIVLGFGIASFAVRNSHFWLHLGTGRLVAKGEYKFGEDPFSYTTAGRTWVNHAWLSDLLTYGVYSASGGRTLVVVKAMLVAVLVLLLLMNRRPERSLWPGVVWAGLALLASAQRLTMEPSLFSFVFLAATLLILTRAPAANSWRTPVALGVLFWFWANCDEWFFLGPAAAALYLVGEALRQRLQPAVEGESRPSLRNLALALGVGVAACMLNPHHVRVWQLPGELMPGVAGALRADPEFARYFRAGFERGTFDFDGSRGGNPVNGIAFLLLVLLNLLGVALNFRRLPWGLVLVNAALLALALVHARAIPFYAVAAAVTTARNFAAFSERLRQRTFAVGTLHALASGRVGARVLTVVAGLAALVACYPGWLQPFALQRRLDWAVEPDPSLEKTAKLLQGWRESGKLPEQAHSLLLSPDLADYCAWFAPAEKTFFDHRLGLHAPEAEAFVKMRQQYLPPVPNLDAIPATAPLDAPWLTEALNRHTVTHVVIHSGDRLRNQFAFLNALRSESGRERVLGMLWVSDGYAVMGRRLQDFVPPEKMVQLRMPFVELAFGANVQPLADPGPLYPPVKRGYVEKFLGPAPAAPGGAHESFLMNEYMNFLLERRALDDRAAALVHASFACAAGGTAFLVRPLPQPLSPDLFALAILSVRESRRAILESPDHPDGYFALANAYNNPQLFPVADESLRNLVISVCLERFLARVTPDYQNENAYRVFTAAGRLSDLHFRENRADLALDALKRALAVLRTSPIHLSQATRTAQVQQLEGKVRTYEMRLRENENAWLNNTAGSPSQLVRAIDAERRGLFRKALEEMRKVDVSETSKLPVEQRVRALIEIASLDLLTGLPENADAQLRELDEGVGGLMQRPDLAPLRRQFYEARRTALMCLGRYTDLTKLDEQIGSELHAGIEQERNLLPQGYSLSVARWLASGQSIPVAGIMGEVLQPELSARIQMYLSSGQVRGNPSLTPFFDAFLRDQFAEMLRREESTHFQLGMLLLERGDTKGAAFQFQQVPRSMPKNVRTEARIMAELYLRYLPKP